MWSSFNGKVKCLDEKSIIVRCTKPIGCAINKVTTFEKYIARIIITIFVSIGKAILGKKIIKILPISEVFKAPGSHV